MIIIGVDPDSDKHGVAFYTNGQLESLEMLDRNDLILAANRLSITHQIKFSIEDVCINNSVFQQKRKGPGTNMNIARSIGKVQQAQIELVRDIEKNFWEYVLHKPSSMWKKDSAMFERVTGWKGRSNEDTRSAAYFGYLEAK